jgi:hypothetical protein
MWKKLMFGIIIGVMLLTVSSGVIYGAQINPASSSACSIAVIDGNGSNQNGTGDCDGTGNCDGTGDCINQNGNGDCDGTGNCINQDGTSNYANGNCIGNCNEGLIKQDGQNNDSGNCGSSNCPNLQNGQAQNNNSNGVGTENKKASAGSGYSASGRYKFNERYTEKNIFMNAFAKFLSFFKSGNKN